MVMESEPQPKVFEAEPGPWEGGAQGLCWGLVTFAQRFGSSLNLNPHMHVLMLDGVYVNGEYAPVFVPAPPVSDPDV